MIRWLVAMHLVWAGALFMAAFMGLSLADLVYFHLWKHKLFSHADSRQEHLAHTLRAILFAPILYLLFGGNHAGALLWLAMGLVVADLGVEVWDVLIEHRSRRNLGGLSSLEYLVHVLVTTLRIAAIALVLAAKPVAAWSLSSPTVLEASYPEPIRLATMLLVPGAVLIALVHLWLLRPRYREATG